MSVTSLNNDPINNAVVEIIVFFLPNGTTKTAYVHEVFTLNANNNITRSYVVNSPIAPNVEFQFGITNVQDINIFC